MRHQHGAQDKWLNSGGELGAITDPVIPENCELAAAAKKVIKMLYDQEECLKQDGNCFVETLENLGEPSSWVLCA